MGSGSVPRAHAQTAPACVGATLLAGLPISPFFFGGRHRPSKFDRIGADFIETLACFVQRAP